MSHCRGPQTPSPKPAAPTVSPARPHAIGRKALEFLQYIAAATANFAAPTPKISSAHDLLKSAWMANYLQHADRVLDIGCGDGQRLRDLSLFVDDLDGVGVDVTIRPSARVRLPQTREPLLQPFDGQHLAFEDRSFDVAMFCYVLHHLSSEHAEQLVAEAMRVSTRRLILLEDSCPEFSRSYTVRNWAHATEANLDYASQSASFRQNFHHTMFKTHEGWCRFLRGYPRVRAVSCVPLTTISRYKHHTMFVVELT